MNRPGWTAETLLRLERQLHDTRDSRLYRRTLALLEYARGRSVSEIARSLGVTRQSIYNWLRAYDTTRDIKALSDATRTGRPRLWTAENQALLRLLLETSPDRFGYVAVSWTVSLLRDQIERTTGSAVSEITVRRALRAEQYVWKRPRYVLEPDPDREKKTQNPPNRAWIAS